MIKDTPSPGRILAMVGFAFSCFAILLYLWISFGGTMPLAPKSYRFKAHFDEAAMLVEQADVRIAGLSVGKVVDKQLDAKRGLTIAEIEMEPRYAPIPSDTRTILRIKALLGETFVELSPGSPDAPKLPDGGALPRKATAEQVQIDEIISIFDDDTKKAFRGWIRELATAIGDGRSEDLNNALGHLPYFVANGRDVLRVLDEQEPALRGMVRNSGRTLAAVNERRGQLRQLIGNANNVFDALASRNDALAETIYVLPTFLDESRATFRRLRRFAVDTRPLVRDLQPTARDIPPTLRDVRRLAPDLRALFRALDPLIDESGRTLPSAARFVRGAEPVFEGLHLYLPELNPILSYLNYYQQTVSDFIMNGSGSFSGTLEGRPGEGPRHYLRQFSTVGGSRGLGISQSRPNWERGNAYPSPNYFRRYPRLGIFESFDCSNDNGGRRDPEEGPPTRLAPCFVAPPQLFDGRKFPRLGKGDAPVRPPPAGLEPGNPKP